MHKTWHVGMLVMVMVAPGGLATGGDSEPLLCGSVGDHEKVLDDVRTCVLRRGEFCVWGEAWKQGAPAVDGHVFSLINGVENHKYTLPARTWSDYDMGHWVLIMGIGGAFFNCQKHIPADAVFVWQDSHEIDEEVFIKWFTSDPPVA